MKDMVIQTLLNELTKTRKTLKTAIGISEEKTMQHYLKSLDRDLEETILATEKTLEEDLK